MFCRRTNALRPAVDFNGDNGVAISWRARDPTVAERHLSSAPAGARNTATSTQRVLSGALEAISRVENNEAAPAILPKLFMLAQTVPNHGIDGSSRKESVEVAAERLLSGGMRAAPALVAVEGAIGPAPTTAANRRDMEHITSQSVESFSM